MKPIDPATLADRELDIAVAEALGYVWYSFLGKSNLVHPAFYDLFIAHAIPIVYQEGKLGEVAVEGNRGMPEWPALPHFSTDIAIAMSAAEQTHLFERSFVLTRFSQEGDWLIARIAVSGHPTPYAIASTAARAICEAIVRFSQE